MTAALHGRPPINPRDELDSLIFLVADLASGLEDDLAKEHVSRACVALRFGAMILGVSAGDELCKEHFPPVAMRDGVCRECHD